MERAHLNRPAQVDPLRTVRPFAGQAQGEPEFRDGSRRLKARGSPRFSTSQNPQLAGMFDSRKRMMGLEPTTSCMANRPRRVRLAQTPPCGVRKLGPRSGQRGFAGETKFMHPTRSTTTSSSLNSVERGRSRTSWSTQRNARYQNDKNKNSSSESAGRAHDCTAHVGAPEPKPS